MSDDSRINEVIDLVQTSSLTPDEKFRVISYLLEERDSNISQSTQLQEYAHRFELFQKKAEFDLQAIKSSWTWRLGRVVLLPINLFKRRGR